MLKMVGLVALLATTVLPVMKAQDEEPQSVMLSKLTSVCCAAPSLSLPRESLLIPDQSAYESRHYSYFNVNQQTMKPSCVVQPRSTEDVATAVKVLTAKGRLEPCKFAIRSGGHGTYAGASNIHGGVALDVRYMNTVEYDAKSNIATVGPGATWDDVYTTLEPLGVMIAEGRSSSVGVGGLNTGGGISYISSGHGFVCDGVVEFEVVLADGRVVIMSRTSHNDLFTVLKGGTSNFGIVTAFKFQIFQYSGMWGGLVVYPGTTMHHQFKALVNFANNIDKDPKGAAIVISLYQSTTGVELFSNAYDYAETVLKPAAYDEFFAIPGIVADTTGIRNMSSLANKNGRVLLRIVKLGIEIIDAKV